MLALSFTFPGGRYHATPWGCHVNEADLEWPPSPWRIVRALIAVWHRKLDQGRHDVTVFERLLGKLAEQAPHYQVPNAVHAHTRHYMPVKKNNKPKLIFDSFARLDSNAAVTAVWPEVDLDDNESALLDALLVSLGFLGRAESWADAVRLPDWSGECNCVPGDDAVDTATGEIKERLSLYMPIPPEAYRQFRSVQREEMAKRELKPRERKRIEATLPGSWLAAVSLDTSVLRAAGWNAPPAARRVSYVRPAGLLRPVAQVRTRSRLQRPITTLRFAMYGKPLPRIEDAVRIGELLRKAAMSRIENQCGKDAIPPVISGHGLPAGNRHQHAFWLPEASDDGHITHLLIHIPAQVESVVRKALESLTKLWNRDGQEWRLVLEKAGMVCEFSGSVICACSSEFVSVTPYLMPWHMKKNFIIEDQIRRECKQRGLPELTSLELVPFVKVCGRRLRPIDFHRFRSKRGLTQPDTRGSFWKLTFAEPVQGPLALGFGCHFGLGLFAPDKE